MLCELFGYSKQAYYKAKTHAQCLADKVKKIKDAVLLIRRQMPRLGGKKLHYLLKEGIDSFGVRIGRDQGKRI